MRRGGVGYIANDPIMLFGPELFQPLEGPPEAVAVVVHSDASS